MGAGSPLIRVAALRRAAFPVARGAVASLEMGVPLAVWRQVVDVRRLHTRNTPLDSDSIGRHGSDGLPDDVIRM